MSELVWHWALTAVLIILPLWLFMRLMDWVEKRFRGKP